MTLNWKDKGFTPIPNIVINNPAIPRCVRSTYEAISARAFGKKFSVFVSQETLAEDVGVSLRTISRHLKVLETLRLIKRVRVGKGMTNTIILVLKLRLMDSVTLSQAIELERMALSMYVLNRKKLTMKDAIKLAGKARRRHKPAVRSPVVLEAERILRSKE